MKKAEDIVRARERAAEEAAAERAKAEGLKEEERRRRVIANIHEDAERLLAVLAERGYPAGQMLKVEGGTTFWGGVKWINLAGWEVAPRVHLLSDGRFAARGWGTALLELEGLPASDADRSSRDRRATLEEISVGVRNQIMRWESEPR